jgi:micrococcal nuclease
MFEPAYRYRAALTRVIDGDTYVLAVDVGFRTAVTINARVRGFNAPELHGAEAAAGQAAKAAAEVLLTNARAIGVETYRDEQSFARWVADVYVDGASIAEALIASGHGVRIDHA